MRRTLQQRQNGRFHNAARSRENANAHGDTIPRNRLATQQTLRPRSRCFQTLNNVPPPFPHKNPHISKILTFFLLQKPRRLDRHHLPLPRRKIRTPILHLQAPNPSTHKSPRRRRSNLFRLRRHRRRKNIPARSRSPQFHYPRRTSKSQTRKPTVICVDESVFGEGGGDRVFGESDSGD